MTKLQRTFSTLRACRKPFPLTTTWKDSKRIWKLGVLKEHCRAVCLLMQKDTLCSTTHLPHIYWRALQPGSLYTISSISEWKGEEDTQRHGVIWWQSWQCWWRPEAALVTVVWCLKPRVSTTYLSRNHFYNCDNYPAWQLLFEVVCLTESITPCRASKPSFTGNTWSLLSAIVQSCAEITIVRFQYCNCLNLLVVKQELHMVIGC